MKCLQHTNPYDQTFVFQQIRFSNLYTQGKCRDTGNASEARSVSVSSQDKCLSMCNGTNAVPYPQGIAECFGVEWDAVNRFCNIRDQGATLSLFINTDRTGSSSHRGPAAGTHTLFPPAGENCQQRLSSESHLSSRRYRGDMLDGRR